MANGLHKFTGQEAANAALGQGGWDIVAGGGSVSDHTYIAITVITGTTTNLDSGAATGGDYAQGTVSAVSVDTDLGDTLSTEEIPVGVTIYGRWSSVTMGANDRAIVYRG